MPDQERVDAVLRVAAHLVGVAAVFVGGGYAFTDDAARAIGFTLFGL